MNSERKNAQPPLPKTASLVPTRTSIHAADGRRPHAIRCSRERISGRQEELPSEQSDGEQK